MDQLKAKHDSQSLEEIGQVRIPAIISMCDQNHPILSTFLFQAFCDDMEMSISGDAKDSGGCIEPSFWPIHGALERLYQVQRAVSNPYKSCNHLL